VIHLVTVGNLNRSLNHDLHSQDSGRKLIPVWTVLSEMKIVIWVIWDEKVVKTFALPICQSKESRLNVGWGKILGGILPLHICYKFWFWFRGRYTCNVNFLALGRGDKHPSETAPAPMRGHDSRDVCLSRSIIFTPGNVWRWRRAHKKV